MAGERSRAPQKPNDLPSVSVLLVEADDRLRRALFWRLYQEGVNVLTARDGAEALRLSRDVPGPIELLIVGSLPNGADPRTLRETLAVERPRMRSMPLDAMSHDPARMLQQVKAMIAQQDDAS